MCQVHKAIAVQISSLWLNGLVSKRLLEQVAEEITRTQQANAKARKSHQKRTRRLLREQGVRLGRVRRCIWPSG